MAKRKAKKKVSQDSSQRLKALNAFLMLVIVIFIISFIANLPKKERNMKQVRTTVSSAPVAVSDLKAPEVVKPISPTPPPTTPAAIPQQALTSAPKAPVTPPPKKSAAKTAAITKSAVISPKPSMQAKSPVHTVKPQTAPKPQGVSTPKPQKKLAFNFPFMRPKPPAQQPALPQPKGKIAIVIDDWGYHLDNINTLDSKYPITAAVIPNLSHTRDAVKGLHDHGYEIILHLPMEPKEQTGLEKDTVMTSLPDADMRRIIDRDISEISYIKGVNNHMGSRATSDPRTVEVLFNELNKKHLYFLDSFVTPDSVCEALAGKLNIPFARRDVFLDNQTDPEYIRGQVHKLKTLALERGWAIGIGHDRKNTIEVLKEEMPKMEKDGCKFVFVSELLKQ